MFHHNFWIWRKKIPPKFSVTPTNKLRFSNSKLGSSLWGESGLSLQSFSVSNSNDHKFPLLPQIIQYKPEATKVAIYVCNWSYSSFVIGERESVMLCSRKIAISLPLKRSGPPHSSLFLNSTLKISNWPYSWDFMTFTKFQLQKNFSKK